MFRWGEVPRPRDTGKAPGWEDRRMGRGAWRAAQEQSRARCLLPTCGPGPGRAGRGEAAPAPQAARGEDAGGLLLPLLPVPRPGPERRTSRGVCGLAIKREKHDPS